MKSLILLFIIQSSVLFAQDTPVQMIEKNMQIKGKSFSFYANYKLTEKNENIEHAIITIHGSSRNADTYFKTVWHTSRALGHDEKVLVVSPHFKINGDALIQNEMIFSYEGWWIGHDSLAQKKISSFEVMDRFIMQLANKEIYPNLKTLIVIGHSAGGHLTQRLALGTQVDLDLDDLSIKYVVANPGTYAFLNEHRPSKLDPTVFAIPQSPRCDYNHYKYGLKNLNRYMSQHDKEKIIDQYLQRDVLYFLGEKDIGSVEQTCQAAYQGRHRLGRGTNFKNHLDYFFPTNNHSKLVVPDVGHTQWGMYTSPMGKELLWGHLPSDQT